MIKKNLAYLLGYIKSPVNLNTSIKKILSRYVFNTNDMNWKPASKYYISNTSNFRLRKSANNKVTNKKLNNISKYIQNHPIITNIGMMLYGFNPRRDHDMDPKLIISILKLMSDGHEKLSSVLKV